MQRSFKALVAAGAVLAVGMVGAPAASACMGYGCESPVQQGCVPGNLCQRVYQPEGSVNVNTTRQALCGNQVVFNFRKL